MRLSWAEARPIFPLFKWVGAAAGAELVLGFSHVATSASVATAPLFAIVNHIALRSDDRLKEKLRSQTMHRWSLIGIAALVLFGLAYFVIRLTH